jgi:hypothetical protein
MEAFKKTSIALCAAWIASSLLSANLLAADFIVYSVYKAIDMGNPGEVTQKDYYVNMGSANGLRNGAILEVHRRVATYDLLSQKLYKDVEFPIGKLKVIHVEPYASIARLDALAPAETTPAAETRAIMVGDAIFISH